MDHLETIWKQLNDKALDLEPMIQQKADTSIFRQLEKEEMLRKKYNPLLFALIATIPFVFYGIFYQEMDWMKAVGIACITGSGVAIAIFSQIVKMPLREFQYNQTSIDFLRLVKKKLDQSRVMLTFGVFLQCLLLVTGLYLLIFSSADWDNLLAYQLTFAGIMMGLGGVAIGKSIAAFNKHYRSTYQRIHRFVHEDEEEFV
ncbi:MAG: hypothetical protein AAF242_10985 [Bacteroidota bacterium]